MLPCQEADRVVRGVIELYVNRLGVPSFTHHDQSRQLESRLFKTFPLSWK